MSEMHLAKGSREGIRLRAHRLLCDRPDPPMQCVCRHRACGTDRPSRRPGRIDRRQSQINQAQQAISPLPSDRPYQIPL
jgi:hypothetical protein